MKNLVISMIALGVIALNDPCTLDNPAVMSIYDPAKGGINCDGDCSTVATGLFSEAMYYVAGACPKGLLGQEIDFPNLGFSMKCVDTGPAIKPAHSEYYGRCAVYFDVLWPLHREPAPVWTWSLQEWH